MSPEMEAGRELDALVAEKVLGWTEVRVYPDDDLYPDYWGGRRPGGRYGPVDLPAYSSDIAAAFEVAEKVCRDGHGFFTINQVGASRGQLWLVEVTGDISKQSESAPHAICLAALKAVEREASAG